MSRSRIPKIFVTCEAIALCFQPDEVVRLIGVSIPRPRRCSLTFTPRPF